MWLIAFFKKLFSFKQSSDIKSLLVIQPGRLGDIIICLPIAEYYHKIGYTVYWPVLPQYANTFLNINYANPIAIKNIDIGKIVSHIYKSKKKYTKTIDLSFGFEYSAHTLWWEKESKKGISFVKYKYQLAEVEEQYRSKLSWERNIDKENQLFQQLVLDTPYFLVHTQTHNFELSLNIDSRSVYFNQIENYNIFDWYKVIINATEIHCIDSSLANFIETLPQAHDIKKILYLSHRTNNKSEHSIYNNNWLIQ